MFKLSFWNLKDRLQAARAQPEHVRLRLAVMWTAGAGIVLLVLWLAVFLPLQLYLSR